jgi:hypothetical protein
MDACPDLVPGLCRGKAHRHENLGYAGRRVLVSRKWSGKTLTDHRADRKAWLMAMLDFPATDQQDFTWERVNPVDPDHMPPNRRLLHALADREAWRAAVAEARRKAEDRAADSSATWPVPARTPTGTGSRWARRAPSPPITGWAAG